MFGSLSSNGNVGGYWVDSSHTHHGFVFIGGKTKTLDFPGAGLTAVTGINAAGTAVGFDIDPQGNVHGFTWSAGKFTPLDVQGALFTEPLLINDWGTIAGTYINKSGANPGFVLKDGVETDIDGVDVFPTSMNARGAIVGTHDDRHFNQQGFVDRSGKFRRFVVANATLVDLSGISSSGSFVGYYHDTTLPSPNLIGFVQKGSTRTLINYPGQGVTEPAGINAAGLIAGYYAPRGKETLQAFTTDGTSFAPLNPAGATESDAQAINDAGQIGGNFDAGSGQQVFLATPQE